MSNRYQAFVNNTWRLVTAIAQTTGVTDALKVISTDATGKLHQSMLPVGIVAPTKDYVASEALVAGNFVNIWEDAAVLKVRKADAATGKEANGFVLTAAAIAANVTVILDGTNNALAGLNVSSIYYLGAAGAVTVSPVLTNNAIIQELGFPTAVTEFNFEYKSPITVLV